MPKKLLVADDSITIQKVVGITFANEDFEVTAVDDGETALARARELRPDVILADVVMPRRNGYELCEAVKADPALRHVPVVLLAGTFEAFDEARARSARADGHLSKPFESQALIDKVREVVLGIPAPPPPAPVRLAAQQPGAAPRPPPNGAAPRAAGYPQIPGPAAAPRPAAPAPRPFANPPPNGAPARPGAQPPLGARPPAGAPPPGARPPFPAPGARPGPPAATPPGAPRPGFAPPAGAPPQRPFPPVARPGAPTPAFRPGPPPGAFRPPAAAPPDASRPGAPPAAFRPGQGAAPQGRPAAPAPAPRPAPRRDPFGFNGFDAPSAPLREDDWSDVGAAIPTPAPMTAPLEARRAPPDPIDLPELDGAEIPDLAPPHAFVPPAASTGHAPEPAARAAPADGGEAILREALSKASREVIERVVWEVVPELAEAIIRENLDRLVKQRQG